MRRRTGPDDEGGGGDDVEYCPQQLSPPSSTALTRRRTSYEVALAAGYESCAGFPDDNGHDDDDDDELQECRRPFLDNVIADEGEERANDDDNQLPVDWGDKRLNQIIIKFHQMIDQMTDGKRRGANAIGKI